MQKKRRFSLKKSVIIGAVGTGIAAGSLLWVTFSNGSRIQTPAYTVTRVIDGDTFITTEKLTFRLTSLDAPELDRCGGTEAKRALERMILGKPVYPKILFKDPYDRLISLVYTKDAFVNKTMLRYGYAYYDANVGSSKDLLQAGEEAREKKKGIFNSHCTQRVNTKQPTCRIKGNVSRPAKEKIYYTLSCGVYDQVEVQLYLEDQWFCTEKEAEQAGFRKAKTCPQ